MSLRRYRQQARVAAERLRLRQASLDGQTAYLRIRFARYSPAMIVGAGLIAGWLLGRRRLRTSVQALASAASLAVGLMRTSIGPLAISALSGRLRRPKRAPAGTGDAQG